MTLGSRQSVGTEPAAIGRFATYAGCSASVTSMKAVPLLRPMIAYSWRVSGSTHAYRLLPDPPPMDASGTLLISEMFRDANACTVGVVAEWIAAPARIC